MKMKWIFLLSILSLFFTACEKDIQIKLDDVNPKLVVDASIENGQPPIVTLTNSLNYFSTINATTLANSFVHNAIVTISNGSVTHQLKEYSFPVAAGLYYYYYSIDSSNLATAFTGQLNTSYALQIIHDGKTYTATTTIPNITKHIDSLYWRPAPVGNPDSLVEVRVKVTDPPGFGDYSRYYTKQNSQPFFPGLNSVFDDQIIDGTTYDVQVERGVPRNGSIPENYSFFTKGDTVTFKLSNINKATYDFWRTMEFAYSNVGNPFSSPIKVSSNITAGGLGYFGGYASQYKTIIIPH